MQQLPQIKAAYDWFFSHWQIEASRAASLGDMALLERLEEKRDTLERGVFVLMVGQFENEVNNTFWTAHSNRSANPDWVRRRGWDIDAFRGKRVPFETRLAMVLDRKDGAYTRIINQYRIRNHCAHGGTTQPVGSIDALQADIYVWKSKLTA